MDYPKMSSELQVATESLITECHDTTKWIMENSKKKVTYGDAVNTWLYMKLAEIELRLHKLEKNNRL